MQQSILGSVPLSHVSPLLYPGGKRRLWPFFVRRLPRALDKIGPVVSPFCGAASIELACAANGSTVIAADNVEPLINFWRHYQADSRSLIDRAVERFPLTHEEGYAIFHNELKPHCQLLGSEPLTDMERAVLYFLMNRQSFRGIGITQQLMRIVPEGRATRRKLLRFRDWYNPNLTFVLSDYKDTVEQYDGFFMYFDPPYVDSEYIYGTKSMDKSFNHQLFRDVIAAATNEWILSYKKCDLVLDLYKDFNITEHRHTHHIARKSREAIELLITNY